MRHQIAFHQDNPDKPAKYGLLFKSLQVRHFFTAAVSAGKPQGDPNEFYNKGTSSYGKALVYGTQKHLYKEGIFHWIAFTVEFLQQNGCYRKKLLW